MADFYTFGYQIEYESNSQIMCLFTERLSFFNGKASKKGKFVYHHVFCRIIPQASFHLFNFPNPNWDFWYDIVNTSSNLYTNMSIVSSNRYSHYKAYSVTEVGFTETKVWWRKEKVIVNKFSYLSTYISIVNHNQDSQPAYLSKEDGPGGWIHRTPKPPRVGESAGQFFSR